MIYKQMSGITWNSVERESHQSVSGNRKKGEMLNLITRLAHPTLANATNMTFNLDLCTSNFDPKIEGSWEENETGAGRMNKCKKGEGFNPVTLLC